MTAQEWFLRGVSYVGTERENSEDAANSCRQALLLRPDYAEAHNNLAALLCVGGNTAAAVQHYREALRLRPDYPEAHYNYGLLLRGSGDGASAIEHYRRALEPRGEYVDAHHGAANVLKADGELDEAAQHYEEVLRLRPDALAHNNDAILLEDVGEPQKAEEHYLEATSYPSGLRGSALQPSVAARIRNPRTNKTQVVYQSKTQRDPPTTINFHEGITP